MTTPASMEIQLDRLIHGQALLQKEIDENKREAEAELKRITAKADADIKAANDKIAAIEDERTKALKWGITMLGTVIMGMAYWIFEKVIKGEIR